MYVIGGVSLLSPLFLIDVEPKKIPLDLEECEMHVKVPLNAFIVVFVRALDKQTPLSS